MEATPGGFESLPAPAKSLLQQVTALHEECGISFATASTVLVEELLHAVVEKTGSVWASDGGNPLAETGGSNEEP